MPVPFFRAPVREGDTATGTVGPGTSPLNGKDLSFA
jgi:hypothetical protein